MVRKQRIHYPGALYHVMVRGNNREKIFSSEISKIKYIQIISKYKKNLGFKLFAYCIMDNHTHLLIQVEDAPLSSIMQRIQQVYTQWYNRSYGRTGHVFQQRYKAMLCNKENYLLQVIKYIHFNPVKANMCPDINYKWSSHFHYTGIVNDGLVDTVEALEIFSETRRQAVKEYLQFMGQEPGDLTLREFKVFQPEEKMLFQANIGVRSEQLNIDELVEKVCNQEQISIKELVKRTRIQKVSDIRKAIVLLSERHCNVTNTLLAQELNLPLSMISKIKSGESKGTGYVQEIIWRFEGNK